MATQPERDPRLSIGGNNPPLADSIVIEFDQNLKEYDFDLLARITEIEAKASEAGPIEDDDTAARYAETVKIASTALKAIEAERETLNRPILNAQRALMGAANVYKDRLVTAEKRIRRHLDDYTEKRRREREAAERERLRKIAEAEAEARRVAEAERQRLQAIADEQARQERLHLQAIADEEARKERLRLQAIEDERAAAEARAAKEVVVMAAEVKVEAAQVEVEVAPVAELQSAPVYAPVRSDRGVLLASTETWHVEIENIRQVPNLYLCNPAVIEALQKVIAPSVRGKNGLRYIKGCRIYSTIKAAVR